MEPNDFLSGLTQNKNPESDSIRLAVLIDLGAQGQWSEILSIPPGEYDGLAVLTTALRILDEESERGNTGEEPEAPQPRCHCGSFLKAQPDEVWHTQRRVQDCGRREVAERRG